MRPEVAAYVALGQLPDESADEETIARFEAAPRRRFRSFRGSRSRWTARLHLVGLRQSVASPYLGTAVVTCWLLLFVMLTKAQ